MGGTMRASLAELTGVDLRGLGLTATRSNREVPVRAPPLISKFIPA